MQIQINVNLMELNTTPKVFIAAATVGGMSVRGGQSTIAVDALRDLFGKLASQGNTDVNLAVLLAASGETIETVQGGPTNNELHAGDDPA